MLYSLRRFSEDEVAVQRMKMIKFYEAYGEKASGNPPPGWVKILVNAVCGRM